MLHHKTNTTTRTTKNERPVFTTKDTKVTKNGNHKIHEKRKTQTTNTLDGNYDTCPRITQMNANGGALVGVIRGQFFFLSYLFSFALFAGKS